MRSAIASSLLALVGSIVLPGSHAETRPESSQASVDYVADGRAPLDELARRFTELDAKHGWAVETVYAYPDAPDLQIRAWRTAATGPALWVLAGIHGEEPAGPNAIARELDALVDFARSGVPVVVVPLCNPRAYRHNWR
ncbi:MAG TPA: hypothetical protein VD737_00165, partial [Steroidobacteraceae bacterium]|nr:hypothetical protein [Steroidobacteraceae bacterium]